MIVDESSGLHEGIADCRADEAKSQPPKVPRHRDRLFGDCRHRIDGSPPVLDRPASDEGPHQGAEVADVEEGPGVADECVDLRAVADDARVRQERRAVGIAIGGHALRVESVERVAVPVAPAQDRDPGEAGLGALQAQQFEQPMRVAHRHTPLEVVIGDVERVGTGPSAARQRPLVGGHRARG